MPTESSSYLCRYSSFISPRRASTDSPFTAWGNGQPSPALGRQTGNLTQESQGLDFPNPPTSSHLLRWYFSFFGFLLPHQIQNQSMQCFFFFFFDPPSTFGHIFPAKPTQVLPQKPSVLDSHLTRLTSLRHFRLMAPYM